MKVSSKETAPKQNDPDRIWIRAYSAPSRLKRLSNSFGSGKSSQDIVRLSKPFEIHPALLVLLAVFCVSLMLSLWGGELIPVFATITGFVLVGTAAVFLILYALVWLARTIYTRRGDTFQLPRGHSCSSPCMGTFHFLKRRALFCREDQLPFTFPGFIWSFCSLIASSCSIRVGLACSRSRQSLR